MSRMRSSLLNHYTGIGQALQQSRCFVLRQHPYVKTAAAMIDLAGTLCQFVMLQLSELANCGRRRMASSAGHR